MAPKAEKSDGNLEIEKNCSDAITRHIENRAQMMPQIRAALSASLGFLVTGTVNGWSASTLSQINEDFIMGATENALVVSMIGFGALFGFLAVGKVMDLAGRRASMLIASPLLCAGWVILGLATHIYVIYLGRFICGTATSFILSSTPIYISETCQAELRGRLGSLPPLALSLGIFLAYTLGGYLTWRTSCFVMLIPAIVFYLCMYTIPESPYWYLLKSREDLAGESLTYFRGPHYDIHREMKEMLLKLHSVGTSVSLKELFKSRTRFPLLVALFIQTLQQVCGGNVLMMYTSQIFEDARLSVDVKLATSFIGLIQVVSTIVSIACVDRFGRRFILALSVILSGVLTAVFGAYFLVLNSGDPWPSWLPLLLLLLIVFCYCLGCRSVPWLITSEVFNTSVRSQASAVCNFYNRGVHIVVIQVYPYLREAVGISSVFFGYGVVSLICGVITLFFVPETKGKSLEQIQEYFENKAKERKGKKQEDNESGL